MARAYAMYSFNCSSVMQVISVKRVPIGVVSRQYTGFPSFILGLKPSGGSKGFVLSLVAAAVFCAGVAAGAVAAGAEATLNAGLESGAVAGAEAAAGAGVDAG
jgi:hypothetical protein